MEVITFQNDGECTNVKEITGLSGLTIYQTVQALERQNVRVNLYIIIGTTTRKKQRTSPRFCHN